MFQIHNFHTNARRANKKIIKRLQTELKANASSKETDLGGGNYGYLGLVKQMMSDQRFLTHNPSLSPNIRLS